MAVSEIRRQRDLFEQKKKQKFVEKQRRKKKNQVEENQSDDRATYSVHSDIDEGVGVSMYSADVTTAGTWGGSTEQSSSEEDSAVEEDYPAAGEVVRVFLVILISPCDTKVIYFIRGIDENLFSQNSFKGELRSKFFSSRKHFKILCSFQEIFFFQ